MKKSIKIFTVLCLSMVATSMAISIFVNLQLGADTLTVLLEGIHISGNVSLGTASRIVNFSLLAIAFLLNRDEVKMPTFLFTLLVGYVLDFVNPYMGTFVNLLQSNLLKAFGLLLAQLLISFGFAILIENDFGMQSLDVVIYYFVNRFKASYVTVKLFLDAFFLITGWLLGGIIGVGTIVSLLTTGLFVQLWLKTFNIIKGYLRNTYGA